MRCRPFPTTLLAVFLAQAAPAMDPDAVSVRCSVKLILSSGGALPEGRWRTDAEVRDTFEKMNQVLEESGANWKLILTEVGRSQAASDFYTFSARNMRALETAAMADRDGYLWRDDAINIYVANVITDAGGVCSLPAGSPSRHVIVINSVSILGGSEGWLHEVGHYFNLLHTHEGDLIADTIFDPPIPQPFSCSTHDESFIQSARDSGASALDTDNVLHNVMSYHCDPQVLTPLQIVRMRRALRDHRMHVFEPDPADSPPTARIRLPPEAASGKVDVASGPITLEIDGSESDDGDGGDGLTCRWSVSENPSSGALVSSEAEGWERGPSGIGYGDSDDLTQVGDMQNRYLTVYMTRAFEVQDPAAVRTLELDMVYDDGFIAYLNGEPVARRNLAADAGPDTPAQASLEGREIIDLGSFIDRLVPGRNRLSIEVHNHELESSDLTAHPVLNATAGGARTALIASRDIWHFRRGSRGAPPAGWTEAGFDASATRALVTFSEPGTYRVRLTVDDGLAPDSTASDEVEIVAEAGVAFVRGDCDSDGNVDLTDGIAGLLELFSGGPPAECPDACDTNDDERRNITDAIALLSFLFLGADAPPAPYPDPGPDLAGDTLGCR